VELTVATRREGVQTVISVVGEIDVYTAPTLRERLNELVSDGEYHLIVDLAGVDFLDSTGLGVLVGGLKRARSHEGSLQLVCDQEKILKVFRITGLTKVFPIHASLREALTPESTQAAGRGVERGIGDDVSPVTISLDSTLKKTPDGESSRGTP
jgi:anti-sigma B factor antagonist